MIFFRLWYLQVLSGEQYVREANANRVRDLPIPAPRGQILDREGKTIVASRTTNAVQIVPSALPPRGRAEAGALPAPRAGARDEPGTHRGDRRARAPGGPYAPVTVKTDAGRGVLTVLGERQNEFPGVVQQPVSIRAYPYGDMAAQVIGHVSQVSEQELKLSAFRGVKAGHDRRPGRARVLLRPLSARQAGGAAHRGERRRAAGAGGARADPADGRAQPAADARPGAPERGRKSDDGGDRTGARAAANRRPPARSSRSTRATARSSRSARSRASTPTSSPNRSRSPSTSADRQRLDGRPLTDRAVNGEYPTGSTFKPITAMAALEGGVITPGEGLGVGLVHHRRRAGVLQRRPRRLRRSRARAKR